jgi:hypothetical protein
MSKATLRPTILALAVTGGAMLLIGCEAGAEAEAQAVPTRVMVRVVSRDAKIIGSGVGGATVRIENVETGEVLAEGKQAGGTGDTRRIMSTPRERDMTVYGTEGAGGYLAQLSLSAPTRVRITGSGPLDYPQATQSASKTILLVPGEHVEGDGVVLELHGFIVEVQSPEAGSEIGDRLEVTARVRMMCGCPIEPGGLWDSNEKEVVARFKVGGEILASTPLEFSGNTSIFTGTLDVPREARGSEVQLEVLASDAARANFGHHEISLGTGSNG